jgi:hypothetical protein
VNDVIEDKGTDVLEDQVETVFNLQSVYQREAAM